MGVFDNGSLRPGCAFQQIISPCIEGAVHFMNTAMSSEHLSKITESKCLASWKTGTATENHEIAGNEGYIRNLYSDVTKTKDILLYLDCNVENYAVYVPKITRAKIIHDSNAPYMFKDSVRGYYSVSAKTASEAKLLFNKSVDVLVQNKSNLFEGYKFSLISESQKMSKYPMALWSFEWLCIDTLSSLDEFDDIKRAEYPDGAICIPQMLYITACNRDFLK